MDPRRSIRNGFANGYPTHSHFYASWNSRHQSSMIPKALKFATLQKKWPPYIPHTKASIRSAPCKVDVQRQAAPSFTVEIGHLHGYEGGGSGQSHPENADQDQRVDKHGWS